MDYASALDWLADHYNLEVTGATVATAPTLERMAVLVELLGDPQHEVPMVHVSGTNGKGSTTRMISALLTAHGLRTGAYTSPTLERVNERITDDNVPLSDYEFAEAVSMVAAVEPLVAERAGREPSYFELTAAAAYAWMAAAPCGAAVVEVGLGGRYDATNVGDGEVAVITNVGFDHAEWIGPTRLDIANEKAGIVKASSHLVLGETDEEIVEVFDRQEARERWHLGRDVHCTQNRVAVGGRVLGVSTPFGRYDDVFLPLHGEHQGRNAALAIAATEAFFGRPIHTDVLDEAFGGLTVPGRFEVVGRHPLIVLDGAHNPEGAAAAAATLRDDFALPDDAPRAAGAPPTVLVVGMNRPRQPDEMLAAFATAGPLRLIATAADWPKAIPPAEIADAAAALDLPVEVVPSVADACDVGRALAGGEGRVLVAGSLYVVGEARSHLVVGDTAPRST